MEHIWRIVYGVFEKRRRELEEVEYICNQMNLRVRKIMAKGKHCFLLSFSNKEEMENVKEGCNFELGQKGIFIKSMEKDINEPMVVWIEIRGIPIRAWSVETCSNITYFWGDFFNH